MPMPLTLQGTIVTNGKEKRLAGNLFELELEGYHLFQLDAPVNVRKSEKSGEAGTAIVRELTFKNSKTTLVYDLESLHGVN
ncbi:DUF2584 family protein [Fictibacillus aquaticus]|uniref:DUF2584 domain-containing protein n=1 Tax=Fictibacillus aquaticus TaxID=2021314 RepID=A0A235F8X7_9BACL|nr:DUF2584 family protein [Fictibacillus aquaticus]OYD57712.1 hypothetical protein CGZ90_13695 [Fictibacillus aquaticus]